MHRLSQNKLHRYLFLLQIFIGQYCYGQNRANDSLFERFRNDVLIEQQEYGRLVWGDETRETFYLLMSTCPIDLLVKYTDDSIPAVRAEIFGGLYQKRADKKILQQILNKHLDDTAEFTRSTTDVVFTHNVRQYMQMLMDSKTYDEQPETDFKARLEKIRRERNIYVPGTYHGFISKDSLLKRDSLVCSQNGFKVVSFLLTIRGKSVTSPNILSKSTKKNIKSLRPGERIFIESIKAEGPDKKIRTWPSIFLKIK